MSLLPFPAAWRRRAARALASACALALALGGVPTASVQAAPSREPVTLNFVNAEIEGVARAMGAILDRQIVVDPRVRGQITLYSEQPLPPQQAYLNFLAALRGVGFTVVEVAGLYKVVPEADAKLQTGTVSVGGVSRSGDQIITQIFRLQHESANNLVAILRPLISPNNTINANPGNNTLVITDYADNLQRLAKMIAAIDVAPGTDVEVIPLRHAVAVGLVQGDDGQAVLAEGAAFPGDGAFRFFQHRGVLLTSLYHAPGGLSSGAGRSQFFPLSQGDGAGADSPAPGCGCA